MPKSELAGIIALANRPPIPHPVRKLTVCRNGQILLSDPAEVLPHPSRSVEIHPIGVGVGEMQLAKLVIQRAFIALNKRFASTSPALARGPEEADRTGVESTPNPVNKGNFTRRP
jgi:hypothetical protein